VQIRLAQLTDAEAIRQIYNREVQTTTHVADIEPRSLDEQRDWLQARSGAHVVLVAELDGQLAGFCSLSHYRDRPAYRTTVENSVYVHRDFQARGVGKALMRALIDTAREHGFHAMVARVVGDNDASVALHRAVGFEVVGVEREVARKFGHWLDVTLMHRLL